MLKARCARPCTHSTRPTPRPPAPGGGGPTSGASRGRHGPPHTTDDPLQASRPGGFFVARDPQECHSERRLTDPDRTPRIRRRPTVRRASRRPAHARRRVPAAARPRPGVPARVGRARPAGRPLLVPGRRLPPDPARRRAGRRPVRAAARGARASTPTSTRAACRRSSAAPSATSAYDAVRRFEPTVPLPERRDGDPAAPARFLLADRRRGVRPRAPHRLGHRHARPRPRGRRGRRRPARRPARSASGPVPSLSNTAGGHAEVDQDEYEAMVEQAQRHIVAGDAFQIVVSQRHLRPDGVHAVRGLPGAAGDQPVAVHGLPRLRQPADRLGLARDPRLPRRQRPGHR